MKVIVYTQAYNAEKTLPRTIDSILGQTFQNIEYYVLDNGSTDRTREIILEYAKRDQRVKPLTIKINDPQHGGMLLWTLFFASDADYFVWCDADDTYSPDFLEKMTTFASENQLDIAACGYDMIDGGTGALLKHRVLPENLILQGQDFADRFIEYRGFTLFLWGKLFSIPFMKRPSLQRTNEDYSVCADSMFVLFTFQKAQRAGIYGQAMYQYYQYPSSLSNTRLRESIESYRQFWASTKQNLEHFGPISKVNEDFLYAISLSLIDEFTERVFPADMSVAKKLALLRLTFQEPLWAETLAREADPQFRNLAGRREYVARMKERILALADTPEEKTLAEAAVRELDKPIAGASA